MRQIGDKEHEGAREYEFSRINGGGVVRPLNLLIERGRGFAPCFACLSHSVRPCMCDLSCETRPSHDCFACRCFSTWSWLPFFSLW